MNARLEQIKNELTACGTYSPETLAQAVVGETILQILATDHRHAVFTTFDKSAVEDATQRIINHVTKHWGFK
jgi:hypothetical protein